MEIEIQRQLKEAIKNSKNMSNDILEAYLEYARMYSKQYWLLLHGEYLRRMEYEISIY